MNLIAQIYGLVALILMFFCYQQNKKEKFLYFQIFANIFYALQYFCLRAYSALATSLVNNIKTMIFYKKEKENKKAGNITFFVFESIFIICGILTYSEWYSIIPIIISCIYTYGTWQRNLKVTYIIGAIVGALWIIYNFIVGAYVASIGGVIELTSALIGLTKIRDKKI